MFLSNSIDMMKNLYLMPALPNWFMSNIYLPKQRSELTPRKIVDFSYFEPGSKLRTILDERLRGDMLHFVTHAVFSE